MNQSEFNNELLQFLTKSPTPFHATKNMAIALNKAGFTQLTTRSDWDLQPGAGYFVLRNDSSIVAFRIGQSSPAESGIRMVGAHTDSPCLRVKPNPEKVKHDLWQLGVETYGGVLLNPWFDRDLSLAGRVSVEDANKKIHHCLIDFKVPIATIPSLAIHLDREANEGRKVNAQLHLPPILSKATGEKPSFNQLVVDQVKKEHPELGDISVLAHELSFYDTQGAALIGLNQEFLASARLDNLLSCFIGLQALLNSDSQFSSMLICTDHEEVGSQSTAGAGGPLLADVLSRIAADEVTRQRIIERSVLISADNAHAIHPNFSDKHDENHGPLLNAGPVIKVNANQRYATNSETSALFKWLAGQASAPVQTFVTRTDLACGSTIGPITATAVGVDTIDVGVPTFGMHSIRELGGIEDSWFLYQIFLRFHALDQLKS